MTEKRSVPLADWLDREAEFHGVPDSEEERAATLIRQLIEALESAPMQMHAEPDCEFLERYRSWLNKADTAIQLAHQGSETDD